jgi:hypothetical protein
MRLVTVLLIVLIILICTPLAKRQRVLAQLAVIGLAVWFLYTFKVIEVFFSIVITVVATVVAFCWDHHTTLIYTVGAVGFASFPAFIFWCLRSDFRENRQIREEWQSSSGAVRVKFDKRVETYKRLGYDQTRAEEATMRIANPQKWKWFRG